MKHNNNFKLHIKFNITARVQGKGVINFYDNQNI